MRPFPLEGLDDLRERLERAARSAHRHHALLLTGPEGVGKGSLARALARGALCAGDGGAFGCLDCGPCGRVEREQHPDLHILARPVGKTRVPIAKLRELIHELGRGALEGRGRAAILEQADALGREGQNSLLKTLEEPAPRTVLILTAARPEALLDTVRSRCERIPIPRLAPAELEAILREEGQDAARAARLAQVAQGCLGRARSLAAGELEESEKLVAPLLDGCQDLAPHAWARRVLEGANVGEEGLRLAKIQRARTMLALALSLARLRAHTDANALSGASSAWSTVEELLDAQSDLAAGLGAELVLASLYARCSQARCSQGAETAGR